MPDQHTANDLSTYAHSIAYRVLVASFREVGHPFPSAPAGLAVARLADAGVLMSLDKNPGVTPKEKPRSDIPELAERVAQAAYGELPAGLREDEAAPTARIAAAAVVQLLADIDCTWTDVDLERIADHLTATSAFQPGDVVRNRRTGAILTVDTTGTWLPEYYELVSHA